MQRCWLKELLLLHSTRDKETLLENVIREVRMYVQDLNAGEGKSHDLM